jgi:general secretion pathway protein I
VSTKFQGRPENRRRIRGFTLLEVLVALVIVSLGMIAVFGQLNQMLSASARLRDKTLAHWIAVDQITELQAIGAYPKVGESSDELDMARATWSYTVKTSQIGDLAMRRVDVTVAFADTPEQILAEVRGFVGPPQQAVAGTPPQGGGGGNPPPGGGNPPPGGGNAQSGGAPPSSGGGSSPSPGDTISPAADAGFGAGWDPLNPNDYDRDLNTPGERR